MKRKKVRLVFFFARSFFFPPSVIPPPSENPTIRIRSPPTNFKNQNKEELAFFTGKKRGTETKKDFFFSFFHFDDVGGGATAARLAAGTSGPFALSAKPTLAFPSASLSYAVYHCLMNASPKIIPFSGVVGPGKIAEMHIFSGSSPFFAGILWVQSRGGTA